ncbi:MAG: hypothetical protein WA919_16800 [Coleofasciculaceae cyanobacterium]
MKESGVRSQKSDIQKVMVKRPALYLTSLKSLIRASVWLPLLLFGSGNIFTFSWANAQPLPEPRVFGDELPLPLPSTPPPSNFPNSPLPPASSSPSSSRREFDFRAPNQPIRDNSPISAPRLYRVEVYGDNPLLLSQIKRVEPEAFVRRGEGIIQAGMFADQYNAQSRLRTLEAQGFQARVTTVTVANRAGRVVAEGLANNSPYLVIIPGDSEDLPDTAAQVLQLGIRREAIEQKTSPRGSHLAIGPFAERREAERWSSYFRSVGMDARVHFRR